MDSTKAAQAAQQAKDYLPIGDYAVIGDLHTVALVGKNGSIDWCCLPRFDSPSVFGALLDTNKGGFFRICPSDDHPHIARKQLYMPETNVLVTRFLTADGIGEITDFMPVKHIHSDADEHTLIRSVAVVNGSLSFELTCRPAFNYARNACTLEFSENGVMFQSQDATLTLSSSVPLQEDTQGGVHSTFTVHTGQSVHFLLKMTKERNQRLSLYTEGQYQQGLQETIHYWRNWLSQCTYKGRWREMVQRSALVLKLLTYAPTGAIVAAPTTSLPEALGGDRNWDYRYTWLRDASFSLTSLLMLGFTEEAGAFMGWLEARCHERKDDNSLQPMYGIDGSHELKELTLDHLEGYRKSTPVHIGNGAYTQVQLDVYGELMDAISLYNRQSAISYQLWEDIIRLLTWLTTHWQEPDSGFWEVRGKPKHYVDSRMMSWAAFDRALRLARHQGFPATVEEWTKTSAQIYRQVMEQGWSEQEKSFVQSYGSDALDASSLLMVLTKFTSPTDSRMLSTIERIQRKLSSGALVHRYSLEMAEDDGMGRAEGTFNACSFWLAEALARAGRIDEARFTLEKILSYSNEVGLYSEKLSPTGEALGNYPQALTHLALISACSAIDRALDAKYRRT
ncbi:MAG: glycoside hydrolase family 15 protein [Ktedonobacteraceae bacterium]